MKKIHFIGIAGAGMSAVAGMLKTEGYIVTGSDEACYPPASTYLKKIGITFFTGYQKENIPRDADIVVIGKNAKLTKENPEVAEALTRNVTVYSLPELLNSLIQESENIIIAGSYGKSTATSLLAWCMQEAGKKPGYFIGARPIDMDTSAQQGDGKYFFLEGDEYPSSNWDARSKFLHYNPHDILLTSVVHDHVNVFPTQKDYEKPFIELLALLPKDGMVFVNADEDRATALAMHSGKQVITYGMAHGDWRATDISYGRQTSFTITYKDEPLETFTTTLLGEHNVRHIVGATSLLLTKNILTIDEVRKHIATFKGLKRRLERKTKPDTLVSVYEGFGSSYEKARAAIEAMQLHYPDNRLVVLFEPHAFGWRNRNSLSWYDSVFTDVAKVFILPPEDQGAQTHDQLTHQEILNRVEDAGVLVKPFDPQTDTIASVVKQLHSGDSVLILTSGNLNGILDTFVTEVDRAYEKI